MHGDRESRQRGDGPVVESVAQSVRHGERDGAGDARTTSHSDERQDEHDHDDREQGGPRQRTSGRESERDGDDLRGGENVDGEDEPDRRAQAQATRRERCGRDDERERAAQDEHAHAPRLTRSSSSGIRYRRVPRSRAGMRCRVRRAGLLDRQRWFPPKRRLLPLQPRQASSGATKRLDSHVPPSVRSSLSLDDTARKRSEGFGQCLTSTLAPSSVCR